MNKKEKIKKVCEICNKIYYVTPSLRDESKFCSINCYGKHIHISKRRENSPNWKERIKKTCSYCKKEFEVLPCRKHSSFCSLRCWILSNTGKNNPFWKEKIERSCVVCKKVFYVTHNEAKANFCSRQCYHIGYKGKVCFNWQGGISYEPYSFDFNDHLKKQIRQRDNFTCQECKHAEEQLGYILHLHHIDYNKKNSNYDNLISLCRICHAKTTTGNRDNWINYYRNFNLTLKTPSDPIYSVSG